ncbi:glycosyltransferase family 2 protein [Xylariomycetidae sp. FL0641]|nr:glycosyltransferase family 2 protein [Xylariomycetidae sp. FL0641]
MDYLDSLIETVKDTPAHILAAVLVALVVVAFYALYALLHLFAPKPRAALPSEKTYTTTTPDGKTVTRQLPCWYDRWLAERHRTEVDHNVGFVSDAGDIEPPEIYMSVVFPAYNEEERILPTLKEAVEFLDATYGRPTTSSPRARESAGKPRKHRANQPSNAPDYENLTGYEILVVDDGSKDRTAEVALDFAREHGLHDVLRVVRLARNRGKGGGVTHGLRHVRGSYALFADADGATRFADLGKLVEGCDSVTDSAGRGLAIGSRAHLVGSAAVVRRSFLRNLLMRCFHLVLTILTPPATSRLRDTQCGFKLFARAALPHVVPYMHAEGWIFDIEMLMLAESAPAVPVYGRHSHRPVGSSPGVKVAEVPVDWHEVGGSKLNVLQDSVRMAVGLAVLRASWMMGVYRRRLT